MKKFIENIQNSDQGNRKKWFIIFSAVTIILVVFLWTFYMKSIIGGLNTQNLSEEITETKEEGSKFLGNIKSIFSDLGGDIKEQTSGAMKAIKDLASEKNDINIEK